MTYQIGKKVHSPFSGIVASFFLAVTPLVVEMAHYARVDATLGFLVIASMFFIFRLYQEESEKLIDYIMAGFFAGLAMQCKPQGIVIVVPFIAAIFLRSWGGGCRPLYPVILDFVG